ncbi:sensor histidine kinase [Enorma phocaeensis]|uniref:sensor histidine kinase n=1 Tax=Enorma phocaeensis TaxID=1871019 RepID=UPI000C863942|nr:ATP-binding protein [Enorma phocaeensis]
MKIFQSIRGKVMAISVAVSAAAMVAITLAVTLATGWAIGATIENSLDQRLDEIEEQLAAGEMPQELRGTGADLVQIIDDTGAVVASSDWATDVGPISEGGLAAGEERREERDRVPLQIEVQDEANDSEEPAPATGAPASPAAPAASSGYDDAPSYAPAPSAPAGGDSGYDGGSGYDGSIRSRFAATARVFARSGLLDADLADLPVTVEGVNLDASSVMGTEGPFVVVERGVQTPDGVVTVAAMTSLAFAREAMATVALILAAVMLVALIAVAGLSWLMVARTLAPVERMRLEAEGISISDLGRRLPVPEQDRDLGGLATTFNDMLSRLEAAVAEQRRFVSDASHELKSPVAAIRVMLETMRDHPDAVDADTLSRDLLSENDRLGGIVGNLLLLARQDEGVSRLDKQQLDLCDLLFEEATALKARTSCEVDVAGVEPVVCTADHEAISHAVRNVLDNAARYAKGKVALACRLAEDAGKEYVEIVVSDDGPGIALKDRERVFGRFVRLEEGRSRKTGSTGLGLSVVRTIARQHGGDAFFTEPELGGATVVIRIEA